MRLSVCMKWVDTRPEIDPLTGDVIDDRRWFGASRADQTALETALTIRDEASDGSEFTVICAGPPGADGLLREALAAGADHVARIDLDPGIDSAAVAAAIASVVTGSDLVVCGNWSLDRGTGSFPAFLAHELGVAQALGCTMVGLVDSDGRSGESDRQELTGPVVEAERRLDGGRRERVRLAGPGVVSVEAGAELRRAGLRAVLAAATTPFEVVAGPGSTPTTHRMIASGPYRPRSREIAVPTDDDPRVRLMAVAGAMIEPTVSRAIRLEPEAAADHLLELLSVWGVHPGAEERP